MASWSVKTKQRYRRRIKELATLLHYAESTENNAALPACPQRSLIEYGTTLPLYIYAKEAKESYLFAGETGKRLMRFSRKLSCQHCPSEQASISYKTQINENDIDSVLSFWTRVLPLKDESRHHRSKITDS